jgi:hypothetical protein
VSALRRLAVLCLFISALAGQAPALHAANITVFGGLDTFMFANDQKSKENRARMTMGMDNIEYGARFDSSAFSFLDFDVSFKKDALYSNLLRGDMIFNLGFFRFGLGWVYGMTKGNIPGASGGLSITVGIAVPGIFYADGNYFGSFGTRNETTGDSRGGIKAEAGFWIKSTQVGGTYENKSFIDRTNTSMFLETSVVKYGALMRFFLKGVPWRLELFGGMKTLKRIYTPVAANVVTHSEDTQDEVNGIYGGARFDFIFSRWLNVYLRGEATMRTGGVSISGGLGGMGITGEAGVIFTVGGS